MALERLKELGHTQLLIPFEHGMKKQRQQFISAMHECYEGVLNREDCEAAISVFEVFDPQAWQMGWKREFEKRRPTAVVVTGQFSLLSFYVFCLENKLNLGSDVSVICLHKEDVFDWYSPRPTCLRFPYEKSLGDFKSWVRSGFPQRKHTIIPMEWCDGETCGKNATSEAHGRA